MARFKRRISGPRMQAAAGAITDALLEASLEAYNYVTPTSSGTFPYIEFSPYLPPLDDWMPLVAAVPVHLAGKYKGKHKGVENFGKGMVLYAAGNLASVTTWRMVNMTLLGRAYGTPVMAGRGTPTYAVYSSGKYTLGGS